LRYRLAKKYNSLTDLGKNHPKAKNSPKNEKFAKKRKILQKAINSPESKNFAQKQKSRPKRKSLPKLANLVIRTVCISTEIAESHVFRTVSRAFSRNVGGAGDESLFLANSSSSSSSDNVSSSSLTGSIRERERLESRGQFFETLVGAN
jgi:hypothetical protein